MTASPTPPPPDSRLLGVLAALPLCVLAWPGPEAVLRGVFAASEATAAGAALLASLPAALAVVLGRRRPAARGLALLLLLVGIGVAGRSFGLVQDGLEASRALFTLFASLGVLLAASTLGERGREALVRTLAVASLALTATAVAWRFLDPEQGWAGILGNTAELASAALPGAVGGACLALFARDRWRWIGAAAFAFFLVASGAAGIKSAPLGAGLALGWVALQRGGAAGAGRAARLAPAALAGLALLLVGGGYVMERGASRPQGTLAAEFGPEEVLSEPGGGGGLSVRRRVWPRALDMTFDHPLTGVGAGQFAVEFPPYRDPAEIETSSFARATGEDATEVEHPHNDYLLAPAEYGLIGGLAFLLFCLLAAARGLREARSDEPARVACAAGFLALAVDAAFAGSLLSNPASATAGFALAGALLARPARADSRAPRTLAIAALGLLLIHVPRAVDMVRHGGALADLRDSFRGDLVQDPEAAQAAIDRARAACPDSETARSLYAQLAQQTGLEREEVRRRWESVLALRPHRFNALHQVGLAHARAGELDEARRFFEEARALDPHHPTLLRNLVRLEVDAGDTVRALDHLATLAEDGRLDPVWVAGLGAQLVLEGEVGPGFALLSTVDERWVEAGGDAAFVIASELRTADSAQQLADAFECYAHLAWARDQVAAGNDAAAVRVYRQSLRISRDYWRGECDGPPAIRAELAAAVWRAGRGADAALEAFAGCVLSPEERAALPAWVREAFEAVGL